MPAEVKLMVLTDWRIITICENHELHFTWHPLPLGCVDLFAGTCPCRSPGSWEAL